MSPLGTTWSVATLGVVAAIALSFSPADVRACSFDGCRPGRFLPRDGATIPQNTPALAWEATRYEDPESVDAVEPQLLRVTGDTAVAVAYTLEAGAPGWFWIVPEALVEGERYRLRLDGGCASGPVEFDVGPIAELPGTLGVTRVGAAKHGPVAVAANSSLCFEDLPAVRVDVALGLAEEAKPWAALLLYETRIDDDLWSPRWSSGDDLPYDLADDEHIVFAECPAAAGETVGDGVWHDGLAPGTYEVQMRATLPGHDAVLLASAETVRLDCGDGGGGCAVSTDRGRPGPAALLLLLAGAWGASRRLRIRR